MPSLEVNRNGVALVQYRSSDGDRAHVLYWGASNWDLEFQYDRSGGWSSGKANWRRFTNACRDYSGPELPFVVASCTAPDGSHWALQVWKRITKNPATGLSYGGTVGERELRLSHWTGDAPELWAKTDWSWGGRYHHLYGQLTFHGRASVPGHGTTSTGAVLDGIGRNLLLDSLDSDYGPGWRRVNGFLANAPNGQFCYGFNAKLFRGYRSKTGVSEANRYTLSVAGPGVGPDVRTAFQHRTETYSRALDAIANAEQLELRGARPIGSCAKIN